jgi:thioredoxin 1
MPSLTLEPDNLTRLLDDWTDESWVVACLCAAWCDVCKQYKPGFEQLALRHPDKQFVWIDVEDRAELVGDFDVENFPTLLIQRGDAVAFYGTVQPDTQQAHRLVQAQAEKSGEELQAEIRSSAERGNWQIECNLRVQLRNYKAV